MTSRNERRRRAKGRQRLEQERAEAARVERVAREAAENVHRARAGYNPPVSDVAKF